jgi:predicted metal-dependent hydrolase
MRFAWRRPGAAWRRPRVMITKDFIFAKDFYTYSIKILRQDKSLRDHGGQAAVAV